MLSSAGLRDDRSAGPVIFPVPVVAVPGGADGFRTVGLEGPSLVCHGLWAFQRTRRQEGPVQSWCTAGQGTIYAAESIQQDAGLRMALACGLATPQATLCRLTTQCLQWKECYEPRAWAQTRF